MTNLEQLTHINLFDTGAIKQAVPPSGAIAFSVKVVPHWVDETKIASHWILR